MEKVKKRRRSRSTERMIAVGIKIPARIAAWLDRVVQAEYSSRSEIIEEMLLDNLPVEYQLEASSGDITATILPKTSGAGKSLIRTYSI